MNSKHKYELILSSKYEFEIQSVNSKTNTTSIAALLTIIFVIFSAASYYNGFLVYDYIYVALALLIIIAICFAVFLVLNNSRSMKLIFTDRGFALSPNKFVFGIPLYTFIAEEWKNILCYQIIETNKLFKIGSKYKKKYHLYVRTDGMIPRCVNNYGVSVFCITGHHLSDDEADRVNDIFCKYSIKKCADDGFAFTEIASP